MADEQLRGDEQYLDEVQAKPGRWRTIFGTAVCLLPLAAVVIGSKVLLFPEMSIAAFALRSIVVGVVLFGLWVAVFRRRLA